MPTRQNGNENCDKANHIDNINNVTLLHVLGLKYEIVSPIQVHKLPKTTIKRKIRDVLFAIFDACRERVAVEAPTLLSKVTKYLGELKHQL